MPTYEYVCNACGHEFERFQSITAAPIRRCPECGKAKVKRLLGTGAGLIFKGSGFYTTDYRDKSYTDQAKSESGSDKSDKAETKSTGQAKSDDAKPAAPAPAPKADKKAPKDKKDS